MTVSLENGKEWKSKNLSEKEKRENILSPNVSARGILKEIIIESYGIGREISQYSIISRKKIKKLEKGSTSTRMISKRIRNKE